MKLFGRVQPWELEEELSKVKQERESARGRFEEESSFRRKEASSWEAARPKKTLEGFGGYGGSSTKRPGGKHGEVLEYLEKKVSTGLETPQEAYNHLIRSFMSQGLPKENAKKKVDGILEDLTEDGFLVMEKGEKV